MRKKVKRYRPEMKAYLKLYYIKNVVKISEDKKKYYQENKVKCLVSNRKFKQEHPHYNRQYLASNPMRGGGKLSIKTIQEVYEENIKLYGTLTCIYCVQEILFGKDSLEHKQPLSRGGTNAKDNLAIACIKCNSVKTNKTEKEYRDYLLTKELV